MASLADVATLSIAGVASVGVGAIVASVVTAVATSRREKRNWLRVERVAAYRRFQQALQSANFRIIYGEIGDAQRRNDELALAKARVSIDSDIREIAESLHDVIATGGPLVARHCATIAAAWEQWVYLIVPLPGAQNPRAIEQSARFRDLANSSISSISLIMRAELGGSDRKLRRRVGALKLPGYAPDPPELIGSISSVETLKSWLVRDWSGAVPNENENYLTSDYPWTYLEVDHANMFQDLAAIALKGSSGPWRFAISRDLSPASIRAVEDDAVRLIVGNIGAYPRRFGAHSWIEGVEDGDRLFLWVVDDLMASEQEANACPR